MPRIMYTICTRCDQRLDEGEDAFEYSGDIFCSRECIYETIDFNISEVEVTDGDCTEEDEDYRDDEDE